jgi:hypothetical protein
LYFELSDGLPIGMKTFCRFPTVIGDCVLISGDVPWPVGDENAGVAERELLKDTEKRRQISHFSRESARKSQFTQAFHIKFGASLQVVEIHCGQLAFIKEHTEAKVSIED